MKLKMQGLQGYLAALRNPTLAPSAIKVALVVGTILFLINHGSAVLQGSMTTGRWFSAIATFFVPYTVNIHGQYVAGQRSHSSPEDTSSIQMTNLVE